MFVLIVDFYVFWFNLFYMNMCVIYFCYLYDLETNMVVQFCQCVQFLYYVYIICMDIFMFFGFTFLHVFVMLIN